MATNAYSCVVSDTWRRLAGFWLDEMVETAGYCPGHNGQDNLVIFQNELPCHDVRFLRQYYWHTVHKTPSVNLIIESCHDIKVNISVKRIIYVLPDLLWDSALLSILVWDNKSQRPIHFTLSMACATREKKILISIRMKYFAWLWLYFIPNGSPIHSGTWVNVIFLLRRLWQSIPHNYVHAPIVLSPSPIFSFL